MGSIVLWGMLGFDMDGILGIMIMGFSAMMREGFVGSNHGF